MKSLVELINENIQATILMTVLDKKSIKTFADKPQKLKFIGADPQYLVYRVKDGTPFLFFSTKKGMQEYINTQMEENSKKIAQQINNIKPGESFKTEDGSIWLKLN